MISFAEKLVNIARQQLVTGVNFKQTRLTDIQKNEDLYYGRKQPSLASIVGYFNVALPIMSGFRNTLMAKIDDPLQINFEPTEEADIKRAQKVTKFWELESSRVNGDWARKDRWSKVLAFNSGVGIYKIFAESDPKYHSQLDVIDYLDFVCEPMGGGNLENHLFAGQMNVYKTPYELTKNDIYDRVAVAKLKSNSNESTQKKIQEESNEKSNRYAVLGLNLQTHSYVGQQVFSLVEWMMEYEGERYYLLFDKNTGIAVRCEKLAVVFASGLYPWVTWQVYEEPFNMWCKGPGDDIRPVAEAMQIIFNQALYNRHKQNLGQRAFDASIFPDPKKLESSARPDALIQANTLNGLRRIGDGIYEFHTSEISGTIDLFQYMDAYLGQKTGITANTQGVSDKDEKVGVYYGNMQQVADRMGLINKSYSNAWAGLGLRYLHGLYEHLSEPQAIKMIGEEGVEWDELVRSDVKTNYDIRISGGNAEARLNEVKAQRMTETVAAIAGNPILIQGVSKKWVVENMLRNAGFDEEAVRVAMDIENEGNRMILSEAALENQQLVSGKKTQPNRGATTGHLQKHLDFAFSKVFSKNKAKDMEIFNRIMAHFQEEIPLATENMLRKVDQIMANAAERQFQSGQPMPMPQEQPMQGTPMPQGNEAGTMSQSQGLSRTNQPNYA